MTTAPEETGQAPALPRQFPVRTEILVFAATAALVLATLLPTLGSLALWYDEIITSNTASLDWTALVVNRLQFGHFPTYFGLMKLVGLGGASEFWIRLPSALFSAGAGGVLALIALRHIGRFAAVATALLYAAFPILISYGQEARPYSMMVFFLSLAMLGHISMLTRQPGFRRYASLATLGTLGAALAIPAGIVAVMAQHIALLACGILRAPAAERRIWLRHLAITWIVILVASLALIPSVLQQAAAPEGLMKWQVVMPLRARILEAVLRIYGFMVDMDANRFLSTRYERVLGAALIALIAIGIAIGFRKIAQRYLVVVAIGMPVAFALIGSVSVSAARYMIGVVPATILLASSGATFLISRPRWRIPAAIILIVAAAGLWLQALDSLTSERKFDWRRVAAFLHDNGVRDVELLLSDNQIALDLAHYLPQVDGITYRYTTPPLGSMDTIWNAAKSRDTAWILTFYNNTLPPEVRDGRVVCQWQFSYLTVFVAARDPTLLPPSLKGCAAAP